MRLGGGKRILHRDPPGKPESELRAVDAVVAAVDQRDRAIDHFEAERALAHRLADAVLDRRDPLLGDRSAVDLFLEVEAGAAGQRFHFDDHVAELAVAARLLLVTALLGHRFADRFAVADCRRVALHLDSVAPLQPREDGVQMLVVDAAQADFVVGVVMLDDQRPIFLAEPLQRARQLDIVLAVRGLDRDRAIAGGIVDIDRRRSLTRPEPLPGLDRVDLRDCDDVAVAAFADLLAVFSPWTLNSEPTRA